MIVVDAMTGAVQQDSDTVSSRQIAAQTGKDHFHLMRDIRAKLGKLGINPAQYEGSYLGGNGESRPEFRLPKDIAAKVVADEVVGLIRQAGDAIARMQ